MPMPESGGETVVKVAVTIDGEQYILRTGSDRGARVNELAALVEERLQAVRENQPNLPRHRAAVLAALNLADEVYRLRLENQELLEVLEEAR